MKPKDDGIVWLVCLHVKWCAIAYVTVAGLVGVL